MLRRLEAFWSSMRVSTESYAGNEAVVLTGEDMTAVILPGLGAKIISLLSHRTGREFIWCDPHRELRSISPGSAYVDNDVSGIDDCFPTIDPCLYPVEPFRDLPLGDHGDLWSRQWGWNLQDDGSLFTVTGATLPFEFEKLITIQSSPSRLVVRNTMRAVGHQWFVYQWAGHPLFRAEKEMRITGLEGCTGSTGFATGGRLVVDGSRWSWPAAPSADGVTCDVSVVPPPEDKVNEKYWLSAAQTCGLSFIDPEERLHLHVDPLLLPWLGVCVNYHGWPRADPGYWVALEPSTSPHDSLTDTWAAGLARKIGPGETHRWWWALSWS